MRSGLTVFDFDTSRVSKDAHEQIAQLVEDGHFVGAEVKGVLWVRSQDLCHYTCGDGFDYLED